MTPWLCIDRASCACHAADAAAAAAGAVPLLVLCVQEPELSLKRVAASALSDIAKHTPELAQVVVDTGAVPYLAPLLVNQDAKLKRQVGCTRAAPLGAAQRSVSVAVLRLGVRAAASWWSCLLSLASDDAHCIWCKACRTCSCWRLQVCSALGQIAKHSVDLAEVVVEAEVFPKCLTCLRYPDEFVQKHAATLVSAAHRYLGVVMKKVWGQELSNDAPHERRTVSGMRSSQHTHVSCLCVHCCCTGA